MKRALLAAALICLALLPVSDSFASKILRVGRGDRLGTGFILASQKGTANRSLVITAWHVLNTQGDAFAKLGDTAYPAVSYRVDNNNTLVWKDGEGHDLAAFVIDTGEQSWVPYSVGRAERGKTYHAYGYGGGSFKATKLQTKYTLLGAVRPGDSGGPIFDDQARVVGMAIEISAPGQGFSANPRFTHTNAVSPEHIESFASRVLNKLGWRCPPGGT
jgi:hypothetical protein